MRLTAIKLSGFKSFVDPTIFRAPTNLTGIVGPNGCGKSNIIDAIRWVMGEGSAKVLRGESMADVIFSGSSSRKPVGTATVELIFDNSDGRVSGEYAGFNEISVRRQVSRDDQSVYFLNNSRCRRKDITDLFLGTGLGSRSYSIIEQGMISQIVDARPEEIRAHLEEAAGISKYKERRRETENRIRHTRENLDRLSDLREEVGKHLDKLKRQARAAERYKELKKQQRELDSKLLALRWRELKSKADDGQGHLARRETELQGKVADQRAAEAALEKLHETQAAASEGFGKVQGELYEVGGDIARLEQSIQHARELQQRQKREYEETQTALGDLEKHMVLDKAQVEELTRTLAEVEPRLFSAEEEEKQAQDALTQAESAVQSWQEEYETHHNASTEQNRAADSKRSVIELSDQKIGQISQRLENLKSEQQTVSTGELQTELEASEKEGEQLKQQQADAQQKLAATREELAQQNGALRQQNEALDKQRRQVHTLEGRLTSLQALQEAALNEHNSADWLAQESLDTASRLAQVMEVSAGWEPAVEAVLGHWLEAVVTDNPVDYATTLQALQEGSVSLLSQDSGAVSGKSGTLGAQVKAPDAIVGLLNQVYTCNDVNAAVAQKLGVGESAITPQGEWIGQGWVRVSRSQSGESSVLQREHDIKQLDKELKGAQDQLQQASSQVDELKSAIHELEIQREEQQDRVNDLHRHTSEVSGRINSQRAKLQHLAEREQKIQDEANQLKQQLVEEQDTVKAARGELESVIDTMSSLESKRSDLDARRKTLLETRDRSRIRLRESRNSRHELALKTESRRASLDSLKQSLARMDTQFSQLQQRYVNLSEQLARTEQPEEQYQTEMDGLLGKRVEVEQRLSKSREQLQQLEEEYRSEDKKRQQAVQNVEELRQALEQAKLSQQEVELNAKNIARQIDEMGEDVSALAEDLPEEADTTAWEAEVERLGQRITRLEPVNLAAIQEYDEEAKRKDYLDSQNEDLCEALATLEAAIEKIDRKTRTRFKETYERVNKGVQELFPRLFGGGHAYLELTGEDLLTTGVSIMARPPGKRVSSIHLLSGGEKALTAVSFVFAIFRLNPAPFCLLDEVDAPLDDANVGRFSALVSEMSETVQFIYVTHNKITMEMAHQLSGVTMREPGVSRLVQVDIDEAAKLASS